MASLQYTNALKIKNKIKACKCKDKWKSGKKKENRDCFG